LGDVDLVVGRMTSPEAMKGLAFEHLYSERIVLAVRPDHPLLAQRQLELSEISRYQLLIPPPGSVIHPVVERYFLAHSVQMTGTQIETVSDAFARIYLLSTTAVWVISEGVIAQDVRRGILATLPVESDDTLGPVGFTTRTDTEPTYPAQLIMSALRGAG
jgi:LysR family pca operon transcriptional activator